MNASILFSLLPIRWKIDFLNRFGGKTGKPVMLAGGVQFYLTGWQWWGMFFPDATSEEIMNGEFSDL